MSLPTASTMVLRRRFDPEETLQAVQEHRAQVLGGGAGDAPAHPRSCPRRRSTRYDLSSLRITSVSGSALPGELATEWMDRFGDTVYNLYGSTEVAYATVATPEDLRAAPGTAGRPPRGTVGAASTTRPGGRCRGARSGGSSSATRWPSRATPAAAARRRSTACSRSGDVGHFDADGRLFIDGRDDEMIVSGGENVFPREVEDLLADHEAVVEVAVIGVEDEEFGQRLKAFVVAASRGRASREDELKAHVKANLAGYKAPREVEFLDELPRNATGKILKRELHAARGPAVRLDRSVSSGSPQIASASGSAAGCDRLRRP